MDWLSFVASIAQIIGTVWVIIFGGKAIGEILKQLKNNAQKGIPVKLGSLLRSITGVTITNILLALILVAILAFSPFATFIHIPIATGAKSTSQPIARTSAVPQVTATPSLPFDGNLILNDPLIDNSQGLQWSQANTSDGSCTFTSNGYQIEASKYYFQCEGTQSNFSNFAFQVTMQLGKGSAGGCIIRYSNVNGNSSGYLFEIDASGIFHIERLDQGKKATLKMAPTGTGPNLTYLIGVVANKNHLAFYIDSKKIYSVTDSTSQNGQIVLSVDGFQYATTHVTFSNAKVWAL